MLSTTVNQKPTFTSINNPIRAFKIKTKLGNVVVREFKQENCNSQHDLTQLSKFFVDNFIQGSTSPGWKKFGRHENLVMYRNKVLSFNYFIESVFKKDDGNSNILVAKDKFNNIVGAIITTKLREVRGLSDSKTMYIDSLAVAQEYRRNNVAKILMEKVFLAGKDIYTDVILAGYNRAVPFYQKLGFKKVDLKNPIEKMYYDILREDRTDIPHYTKLLHMPLKPDAERWWQRMSGRIINYREQMMK